MMFWLVGIVVGTLGLYGWRRFRARGVSPAWLIDCERRGAAGFTVFMNAFCWSEISSSFGRDLSPGRWTTSHSGCRSASSGFQVSMK